MATVVTKTYERFLGVDKRSSGVTISPEAASRARNAAYFNQTTLTARQGSQCLSLDVGALGAFSYLKYDTTLGYSAPEVVLAGRNLKRVKRATFTISYSDPGVGTGDYFPAYFGHIRGGSYWGSHVVSSGGSTGASPSAAMLVGSDNQWHFYIDVFGSTTMDYNCGKGYDETTPKTLQDLKTAIQAVPGFSVSMSASLTSKLAAFIPSFDYVAIPSGGLAVEVLYTEDIPQPTGYPYLFDEAWATRNDEEFEIASAVDIRDSLFIATRLDGLVQYDGQKAYLAGLPTPTAAPTLALVSSGTITATSIAYAYCYVYYDAVGYVHESQLSPESSVISPSSQKVDVTIPAIAAGSGYNTDQAKLAASPATQTGTTFTVLTGNSLKVGDTAYLIDNSGAAHTRTVSASTDTTLTLSGAALTLAASSIISANLRVRIMRQASLRGAMYEVGEFPHDSSGSSFVIRDDRTAVTDLYSALDPLPEPAPTEIGNLAIHQGLIVGSVGDKVFYSSAYDPASWNGARYFDNLYGPGPVRSISPVNEMLGVWKANSYATAVGTLDDLNFNFNEVSAQIGAIAHAPTKPVAGGVAFLSSKGLYAVTGVEIPTLLGPQVLPIFTAKEQDTSLRLKPRQAVGVVDGDNETYLLFVPAFSISSPDLYANANSIVLGYEWETKRWLEWDGLNWAGGATCLDGELWWAERHFSSESDAIQSKLYRRLNTGSYIDYTDNGNPIPWLYVPGWEDLDTPTAIKKATRFKMYSNDPRRAGNFALNIRSVKDLVEGYYESEFVFDFGGGAEGEYGFGYGAFGYEPFGNPTTPWLETRIKGSKCRSIGFEFSHEENYRYPMITGWEVEITSFGEGIS